MFLQAFPVVLCFYYPQQFYCLTIRPSFYIFRNLLNSVAVSTRLYQSIWWSPIEKPQYFSYSLERPSLLLCGILASSPVFGERPCLMSFGNSGKQTTVPSLTLGWLVSLMKFNILVRQQRFFFPIPSGIIQLIIILLIHNLLHIPLKPFTHFFRPQNWHFMEYVVDALCMAVGWETQVSPSPLEAMNSLPLLARASFCTSESSSDLLQSVSRKTAFGFNS